VEAIQRLSAADPKEINNEYLIQRFPSYIPCCGLLRFPSLEDQTLCLSKMRQSMIGARPHEFITAGASLVLAARKFVATPSIHRRIRNWSSGPIWLAAHSEPHISKVTSLRHSSLYIIIFFGRVCATPGALAEIGVSGDDLSAYLARHQSGDWGDIDAHDRKENQLSLEQGFRLMSLTGGGGSLTA